MPLPEGSATVHQLRSPAGAAPLDIAVIGSGIAGLSAAWLLSKAHRVTLYEKEDRPGGHANTVDINTVDAATVDSGGAGPVDTGFIVYNAPCYPNLVALFDHLGVATRPTDMSFAASLDGGRVEYAGSSLGTLFAQKRNLLRPRFWRMLADLLRFYREAPGLLADPDAATLTLGAFLERGGYSDAFVRDHLLPMAAAIWSTPAEAMRDHPAAAFVRFCENHGLLKITGRPVWRTVEGGSRAYVRRILADMPDVLRLNCAVEAVTREGFHADGIGGGIGGGTGQPSGRILVRDRRGGVRAHDHVVFATHADQALALLEEPTPLESRLLGSIGYERNLAILHSDAGLMPRRRAVWSSWNYLSQRGDAGADAVCVTYWMNRLQGFLPPERDLFVTLNPIRPPREGTILRSILYDHPVFGMEALAAQKRLWSLQGCRNSWFAGSYFGAGFHEDGLQSGLAVAEALGGVRRPWTVPDESGRIHLDPAQPSAAREAA
ncbi:NADH-ubiquinone oxidoreductase subunit 6 [Azospirillum thiophilum]|uniref:NADH-ubiquinone oxidoreductase subunit 6 n=1 Tax=Azospirillum thiophilum TaxID=528244 RepID=A0AAC8W0T5_9PROT|nr:FAD-dependent oxidoreductase [Azospirillum thiophilum]ALG73035.1 NADH-ubiquinone oxidoreductase subunit 6 [Azospirillum thiophilum]KJR64050.1 NADH-ubiquinone oxidoreductase subunit 6 [Azospirillum thiophilum]